MPCQTTSGLPMLGCCGPPDPHQPEPSAKWIQVDLWFSDQGLTDADKTAFMAQAQSELDARKDAAFAIAPWNTNVGQVLPTRRRIIIDLINQTTTEQNELMNSDYLGGYTAIKEYTPQAPIPGSDRVFLQAIQYDAPPVDGTNWFATVCVVHYHKINDVQLGFDRCITDVAPLVEVQGDNISAIPEFQALGSYRSIVAVENWINSVPCCNPAP